MHLQKIKISYCFDFPGLLKGLGDKASAELKGGREGWVGAGENKIKSWVSAHDGADG